MDCQKCYLSSTRFLAPSIVGNCDSDCELLIICDYPKNEDVTSGYPLSGNQYTFIWELLNEIGVKYKVNFLLKCPPIDPRRRTYRKPTIDEYNFCMQENFYRELQTINPKYILVFGQGALEVILGESVDKINSYSETNEWRGYSYSATYNPSYVANPDVSGAVYDKFIEDIVNASRYAMAHRSEGVYKTVTIDVDKLERIVDIWCNDDSIEYVGFDTESNGLDPLVKGTKITSFSVAVDTQVGYNIFLYHPELPDITDSDRLRIRNAAKKLLTTKKVVAHHAKHEYKLCKVFWRFTPNITDDTMYMSNILYLGYPGIKHGLKYLSGRFLALPPWEHTLDRFKSLFQSLKRKKVLSEDSINDYISQYRDLDIRSEDVNSFFKIIKDPDYYIKQEHDEDDLYYWLVPIRSLERYAGMDAIAPLMLMDKFKPRISADPGLSKSYSMMIAGANAFANMELKGMRIIDIERWTNIYEERLAKRLEEIRSFDEVKEFELDNNVEFNPNSTKQCADVFFQRFKFPVKSTTGTGNPSTSETTIIDLIKEYREKSGEDNKLAFLTSFREYKKLKKLLSAYLIGLRKFIEVNNAFDGNKCEYVPVPDGVEDSHIHPGYLLHTVSTGRVASANPSLHTIPAMSDIKRLFVSHNHGRGGIIVTADQSQLELRVLACIIERYYGDSSLAQAYREGKDIHKYNASRVFNKPMDEVVDAERRFSKTISFSLLYGASEKSVAESTGRTDKEVHELFESFYSSFPGIRKYIDTAHEYAKTYGCVRTPMGRVKHLVEALHPENRRKFADSLRQAQNGIIQSSGSDMSFSSIIYMDGYIRKHDLDTKIVGFIHDSLEMDASPGEWFIAYDMLKYSMKDLNESRDWVTAPLGIDCELGTSLGDTVAVKEMEILEDNSRIFTLKGYDYVMNDLVEESKYGYDIVSDEILKEEEFINKTGDLIARKVISLSFDNQKFNMQTRRIHWRPKVGTKDLETRFDSHSV